MLLISVGRLLIRLVGLGLWVSRKRLEWENFYVYLFLGV